ncbi:hypothetical protein TeGR_g3100, partial [Tetraparma gracilis]
RGDLDGQDDPVSAQWRAEAEAALLAEATRLGCPALGVTWSFNEVLLTVPSAATPAQLAALGALAGLEVGDAVMERHALVVAAPSAPSTLTSQADYDGAVGDPVVVATQDPFKSNRSIRGVLVGRDAMKVVVDVPESEEGGGGRVEVPNLMVRKVKIDKEAKKGME